MLGTKLLMQSAKGIKGILVGPSQIGTSAASIATAYSNQRKIDRTSNGVAWSTYAGASNRFTLYYSTDEGATWTLFSSAVKPGASTQNLSVYNFSIFIDADDYMHVVWKQFGSVSAHADFNMPDGAIGYLRGTPNVSRTAWTWSAAESLLTDSDANYPSLIAHREGSGWKAHIVLGRANNSSRAVQYYPITIASNGAITEGTRVVLKEAPYTSTVNSYPSIDFNHTGDCKTIAGGTPHLYVAWSQGTTGSGNGIRFRKATYSSGTLAWGTERQIDSTRYIANYPLWLNCHFDGTRILIASYLLNSGGNSDIVLYERDVADTSTTTRVLIATASDTQRLSAGSSTFDQDGNIYLFGKESDAGATLGNLHYYKWERSSNVLGARVIIDASSAIPFVSAKCGYSKNRIEFVYTDGTANPYDIKYGAIK